MKNYCAEEIREEFLKNNLSTEDCAKRIEEKTKEMDILKEMATDEKKKNLIDIFRKRERDLIGEYEKVRVIQNFRSREDLIALGRRRIILGDLYVLYVECIDFLKTEDIK